MVSYGFEDAPVAAPELPEDGVSSHSEHRHGLTRTWPRRHPQRRGSSVPPGIQALAWVGIGGVAK